MLKKSLLLNLLFAAALAATAWAAPGTIQMTVINESHMTLAYIDFSKDNKSYAIAPGQIVSIDIERPNVETNLATLFFAYDNGETSGGADFPLVRAPKDFWGFLDIAPEFIVIFYELNGNTWASISRGLGRMAEVYYLYHPVLDNWGFVENAAGIAVYQDDKRDYDDWQAAQKSGAT